MQVGRSMEGGGGDGQPPLCSQHGRLLMPDIWPPLISDGRVEEVHRMQANVQAKSIYFWGQEMEIARYAIAAGREWMRGRWLPGTVAPF